MLFYVYELEFKMELNEYRVVVTGTSHGIGRTIAERLIERGCMVTGISRSRGPNIENLTQIEFDLSDLNKLQSLWQQILATGSKIDAVILNAGIGHVERFIDETTENCEQVMRINFISPFILAREAVRYWKTSDYSGNLIFIGSQAGLPGAGQAFNSVYSASKAALHSLTGSLSRELAPRIRVNAIAPGDVPTELAQRGAEKFALVSQNFISVTQYIEQVAERAPLKRWVQAHEVATGVVYLICNKAVTGTVLNISAGATSY
jgi:NAD(P)-dependent dehydrogenase (short-subunit alcohol dehydrogenase family)